VVYAVILAILVVGTSWAIQPGRLF
jgi:hypothetical protein